MLDPSIKRFLIEGVPYHGWYDTVNGPLFTQFFESFPHAAIILELGSLEGGQTIGLASGPGCAVSGFYRKSEPGRQPHLQWRGGATAKCESTIDE